VGDCPGKVVIMRMPIVKSAIFVAAAVLLLAFVSSPVAMAVVLPPVPPPDILAVVLPPVPPPDILAVVLPPVPPPGNPA
jgi:hypothetical protein